MEKKQATTTNPAAKDKLAKVLPGNKTYPINKEMKKVRQGSPPHKTRALISLIKYLVSYFIDIVLLFSPPPYPK